MSVTKQQIKPLILLLFICLLGFICFLLLDYIYPMPQVEEQKRFSQLVVDRNGRPLRAFADDKGVWRYPTKLSQVAPNYITALINYEDRAFWYHSGVNPFALFRAVGQLIINGRAISGGSTITMQVARIMQPHSKSISGKIWQMFRAFQLEFYFDKEQILERYLNYAPFGGPIEGIEAATYTYLGKSAKELTDSEAALMAVLPQSPSRFRPDRYAERAKKAKDKVLDRLQAFDIWSKQQVDSAKQEMVNATFNSRPLVAPLLSRRLVNQFPNKQIIHTNIDINLQSQIAELVKGYLSRFSDSTSASALLIDNQNLDVLAYVGAGDFANKKRFGHVDMNQAIRSPGSTLKPFIYAMALDKQLIHSESLLQDVPLTFGQYSPQNFTRNFSGPVSVSQSLQQSLNIPAVQLLNHLGAANFSGQIENAGVKLYFPEKNNPSLSLALGGAGIKLEDLVVLYRSIAANGLSGQLGYLKGSDQQEAYLMSKESAWIVGDILSKVPLASHQSVYKNRGITQRSNQWLAHKTGTSYGHRDAWMVAVTQTHTLAVWIGKPDGTPSPGEFGRKTAAPLVKKIFSMLPRSHAIRTRPEEVSLKEICWPLGTISTDKNADQCMQKKSAWLIDQVSPKTLVEEFDRRTNPIHVELNVDTNERVYPSCYDGQSLKKKIALWPSRLDLWLPQKWRFEKLMPQLDQSCRGQVGSSHRLIIIGIDEASRISLPPNLETPFSLSLIVSTGKGLVSWLDNGELIGQSKVGENFVLTDLEKGQHHLMVFDEQGNSGEVSFKLL